MKRQQTSKRETKRQPEIMQRKTTWGQGAAETPQRAQRGACNENDASPLYTPVAEVGLFKARAMTAIRRAQRGHILIQRAPWRWPAFENLLMIG